MLEKNCFLGSDRVLYSDTTSLKRHIFDDDDDDDNGDDNNDEENEYRTSRNKRLQLDVVSNTANNVDNHNHHKTIDNETNTDGMILNMDETSRSEKESLYPVIIAPTFEEIQEDDDEDALVSAVSIQTTLYIYFIFPRPQY